MKKLTASVLLACALASSGRCFAMTAAPELSAGAAVVMHAETGELLYEKQADEAMLIASTTKLMTALVVLDRCELGETVEVGWEHAGIEGSSMYLGPGGDYTVEQLLYGMLLVSGNDAAAALACHTAGSIEAFAGLMNDKAQELGLVNSSFKNPHGLDEEGHYSCASDLARIMAAGLKDEAFRRIIATESYTLGENTYINHNKLLWSCEGMLGGKTGYTQAAGRSLVTACCRSGMTLICVTLGAPDDWNDHCRLYDWAYDEYRYRELLPDSTLTLPVISGRPDRVSLVLSDRMGVLWRADDRVETETDLPRFAHAPLRRGDRAGEMRVYRNGELVGSCFLLYGETVELDAAQRLSLGEKLMRMWTAAYGGSYVLSGR